MNNEFTEKLQQWMNTPDQQKNWDEGAIMLLQLSGNKIMYANISVNPKGKAEFIKGKLQQYLNFRLQQLTHEEVKNMQAKVEVIVKETIRPEGEFADFKAGKRTDHDTLPDEIKALYTENLDIVHRMRELHLKLRSLSLENATCPDSERYPFLKEIITLDKQLHDNWFTYDHFAANSAADASEDEGEEAPEDAAPAEDKAAGEQPAEERSGQGQAEASEAEKASEEPAPAEEKPKAKAKRTTKKTAATE